jgi:hypothetical protein
VRREQESGDGYGEENQDQRAKEKFRIRTFPA